MDMIERPLGRRIPRDFAHVQKYALALPTMATVERILPLPPFRKLYDQGQEGACVGFGWSWALSILHRVNRSFPRYDPIWLWNQAKMIDEWPDTNPGDNNGTSVRAGGDVLRTIGDVRVWRGKDRSPSLAEGIAENRWATAVDEMRSCIANGIPVVCGTNWYQGMDSPTLKGHEWWMPSDNLGSVRGGHCWCIYGASDRRQAFKMVNNWGVNGYPLTFVPYALMARLLSEEGEATIITKRQA